VKKIVQDMAHVLLTVPVNVMPAMMVQLVIGSRGAIARRDALGEGNVLLVFASVSLDGQGLLVT
jgi:hypothetical protein